MNWRIICSWLANAFPLWVTAAALLALLHPPALSWFATTRLLDQSLIVWGLAAIMLCMGLTLTVADFKAVLRLPAAAGIGLAAQYCIMPLTGYAIAHIMALPTALAVGLILTACCPGGTASNIVTFMARANVALSVLMTMCSTFAALALTPLLTGFLAGHLVPVDRAALFWDTLKVVVLPVVSGVALNHFLPLAVRKVVPLAPLFAALVVALICGSIVAASAEIILNHAGLLLASVVLLHSTGFALGYAAAKLFGYPVSIRRTISIEVGMQNSGLAVVLARQHFADPLTAVPGAISSVVHSVIGSILAGYWRLRVLENGNKLAADGCNAAQDD